MSFTATYLEKISASNAANGNYYGNSIAISADGNTMAAAASYVSGSSNQANGAVRILTKSNNAWTQSASIVTPSNSNTDYFDYALAMSADGTTLVIGVMSANGTASQQGQALIYKLSGGTWSLFQTLTNTQAGQDDNFGESVAISGDGSVVFIGATRGDISAQNPNSGVAYAYVYNGSTYASTQMLSGAGTVTDCMFGASIATSYDGSYVAIGSIGEYLSSDPQGTVYVFYKSSSTWTQQQKITAAQAAAGNYFGYSIAMSADANTLVVGSSSANDSNSANLSSVAVLTRSGTTWSVQGNLLKSSSSNTYEYFGQSMSMSFDGDTVVAGVWEGDTSNTTESGAVYVFRRASGSWSQAQRIISSDSNLSSYFGFSVAMASREGSMVVGAPYSSSVYSSNAGYIYSYSISLTDADTYSPIVLPNTTITKTSTTITSVAVSWNTGIDNITASSGLQYQVRYSTSNNISTIANFEANGTLAMDYTANVSSYTITSLVPNTTYYVNVAVKDAAGNKTLYTSLSTMTDADLIAPTVGGSGAITASNASITSVQLNWTAATDNYSTGSNITYAVYYSTSNNISTVANAVANGTKALDYTASTTSYTVTSLIPNTTYYFNVLVKDQYNNISAYTAVSKATLADTTPPVVGTLSMTSTTITSIAVAWTAATDNYSTAANIQYALYYSASNNIDTVANIEANGTLIRAYQNTPLSCSLTGLIPNTTYYFNVIAKDQYGNKSAYGALTQATQADTTAPVPGASGAIIASAYSETRIDLSWTAATDNYSTGTGITYAVYRSSSNNLDTVANIEANGTKVMDYTANITSYSATGLTYNTAYYFNVIVKDQYGNKAAYVANTATTLNDTHAPVTVGAVSFSNIGFNSLSVSWTAATDDFTSGSNIQYALYRSSADNIRSVSDMETNGTLVRNYSNDTGPVLVTGLTISSVYFFNVIAKDAAGNKAAYMYDVVYTLTDTTPPSVGVLTYSNVTMSSIDLSWTAATDNYSSSSNIYYSVFMSSSNNLSTPLLVDSNGTTVMSYDHNVTSCTVPRLDPSTTYYFTVIAKDQFNNRAIYNTVSVTTAADTIAPVPGAGGNIIASPYSQTRIDLSWFAATDNYSTGSNIKYAVYQSTSNNLDTVAHIQANGTQLQGFTSNLTSYSATGLTYNTKYYYAVLVEDQYGNIAAYTSTSATTLGDVVAPTVGTISFSNVALTSLDISWTAASDDFTPAASIQYAVYKSTSDNIGSVSNIESNGTLIRAYSTSTSPVTASGLTPNTTYYFNVIAKDLTGNKAAYPVVSQKTLADTTPPVVGTLSMTSTTITSIAVAWTAATDNYSTAANIQYALYYSTSNNIDTVANIEANGTLARTYQSTPLSYNLTNLIPNTTYYFNVISKDEYGNKSAYSMLTQATQADTTAPVPGSSGAISTTVVSETRIDLSWIAATDNYSTGSNIAYAVYQSSSSNLGTVANIEANGTKIMDYTASTTSYSVTSLSYNTAYYFNVIVKDQYGNKAAYVAATATTLNDTHAPTVGTASFSNVGLTAISISWTAATDDFTAQNSIQYAIYKSTSNNIDTVANATTNGTLISAYSTGTGPVVASGLLPNTTYYFTVLAKDLAGNVSAYTSASQATLADTTAPAVGVLSVSSTTITSIAVAWTAATDNYSTSANIKYALYYSTSNNIDTVANASANGTLLQDFANTPRSYTLTGLIPNTTYYFNVVSEDEFGNKSAYATLTQATQADTTAPVPGASGVISANAISEIEIDLSWTAATDNYSTGTGITYAVYESNSNNLGTVANIEANGTKIMDYTASTTSYSVTGLVAATTYYFNVIVKDQYGNKAAYTSVSKATKTDTTPPVPGASGAIVATTYSETRIDLSWTAATDNYSVASGIAYAVYQSSSNNISTVANAEANGIKIMDYTANVSSYSVAGLTYNTAYYFNVIVKDTAGNKAAYVAATATTLNDTHAPTVGAISFSSVDLTSLNVSWTAASDDFTAAGNLQYALYKSLFNNINTVANIEANGTLIRDYSNNRGPVSVSSLIPSTTYYFNVIVKDAAGNKAAYALASKTTLADTTPPTVGSISVDSYDLTSINVSWTAASDNYSTSANILYALYYSTSNNISGVANVEANGMLLSNYQNISRSYSLTSLVPNTTYYFNVIAKDEYGNKSAYAAISQATQADTTAPTPGASGAIAASAVSETEIDLSWTAATDNYSTGSNIVYAVYQSSSNNLDTVAHVEANGTKVMDYTANTISYAATGLSPATTYYYNVIAKDQYGNKAIYAGVSKKTNGDVNPPVPGAFGVIHANAISERIIDLTWTAANDDFTSQSDIQYALYVAQFNGLDTVANIEANGLKIMDYTADATSYQITSLQANTTYYFNVIAKDLVGNKVAYAGATRTTKSDTTAPVAGAYGLLNISAYSETRIDMSWTAATDNYNTSAEILYALYQSSSNNLDTVANIEANGTKIMDYTANTTSYSATGLTAATTYYFNVIAKDLAGNKIAYVSSSQLTKSDITSPVPGASGVMSAAAVSETRIDLSWTAATDNYSASSDITYAVYRSLSNNLGTVANIEANGTKIMDYSSNVTSYSAVSLNFNTRYYFNVIAKDAAGNKAAYVSISKLTSADTQSPVPGASGAITTSVVSETQIDLSWTAAVDNLSLGYDLRYAVYQSSSNNLSTVASIEANGTKIMDYSANTTSCSAVGLSANTAYYFNVIVKDTSDNKAMYSVANAKTNADIVPPVVTSPGTIAVSNIADVSLTLSWMKASDNYSNESALVYKIYRASSNVLTSVNQTEANGILVGTGININNFNVTGLTPSSSYYFNIIVLDQAGNKTLYSSTTATTYTDTLPPVPGNSGSISFTGVTVSTINVSWNTGSDNITASSNLQYALYVSSSNNIDTVANIEANGTKVMDYVSNRTSYVLTGLFAASKYYVNIIVRDGTGNKAAYSMGSATTQADVIPPVPGANGAISISYVTTSSLVLNWTKAVDNYTPQSALRYEIRKSLSNNIGSLASIKNGSIIKAFTNDISTISVDGLLPNTTYYFNITVMDSSGNKATYSMANATTMVDNTGPIPGASGAITFSGTTLQETIVNWSRASDHVTYFEDLEYALYYSTSANISSVTQAETNGTLLMDYTVDTITFPMTDLVPGTKYYFNVIVRDELKNKSAYTMSSVTMVADTSAPVPGNSGTIISDSATINSVHLSWSKAEDNITSQSDIKYAVYRSLYDNMSTVNQMEANGVKIVDYTNDLSEVNVTGLSPSSTYYFNVIAMDQFVNKAAYSTTKVITVVDTTAPSPGNSGILGASLATSSSITLSWTKGIDNVTDVGSLMYGVYYSKLNNLDNVANIEANGILAKPFSKDIAVLVVSNLDPNQDYYFNVIVKDSAGNKSCYNGAYAATLADIDPPVPGNSGIIATSAITLNSMVLSWNQASDNASVPPNLLYQVRMSSSNNMNTIIDAETNGTIVRDYSPLTYASLNNLISGHDYYFNVIVKDATGNKALYVTKYQHTKNDVVEVPTAPVKTEQPIVVASSIDKIKTLPQVAANPTLSKPRNWAKVHIIYKSTTSAKRVVVSITDFSQMVGTFTAHNNEVFAVHKVIVEDANNNFVTVPASFIMNAQNWNINVT